MAVGHLLKQGSRRAQQRGFHFAAGGNHHRQQTAQQREHHPVTEEARSEAQALASFNAVERGIANQTARHANLGHNVIAGVHAGGAMDAFHLGAIANVDAGGTD